MVQERSFSVETVGFQDATSLNLNSLKPTLVQWSAKSGVWPWMPLSKSY